MADDNSLCDWQAEPAIPPMPAELALGPGWAGWIICCNTFCLDTSDLDCRAVGAYARELEAAGPEHTPNPPRWLSRPQ